MEWRRSFCPVNGSASSDSWLPCRTIYVITPPEDWRQILIVKNSYRNVEHIVSTTSYHFYVKFVHYSLACTDWLICWTFNWKTKVQGFYSRQPWTKMNSFNKKTFCYKFLLAGMCSCLFIQMDARVVPYCWALTTTQCTLQLVKASTACTVCFLESFGEIAILTTLNNCLRQ